MGYLCVTCVCGWGMNYDYASLLKGEHHEEEEEEKAYISGGNRYIDPYFYTLYGDRQQLNQLVFRNNLAPPFLKRRVLFLHTPHIIKYAKYNFMIKYEYNRVE